jgi:hypothetical protein
LGPRRTTLALALLALVLLVASAGVAAASDAHGPWSTGATDATPAAPSAAPSDNRVAQAWSDHVHHEDGGAVEGDHTGNGTGNGTGDGSGTGDVGGTSDDPSDGTDGSTDGSSRGWTPPPNDGNDGGNNTRGTGSGTTGTGSTGGGDFTGTSVGTPPTPVEAPAAAVSGPAPAAVAAAPITTSAAEVLGSVVPTSNDPGSGALDAPAVVNALPAAPILGPSDASALASLPNLGTVGELAANVGDGPSAARALIETGTGRSVAVLLALLGAILLFLSIHRRFDRGDPKLAAARSGPDLARFR